jgi:pilus assembly protein FimV
MMRNKLAKVGLTIVALHSGLVSALGMGELTLDSLLNQPFRAEIPLRDIGELNVDQIRVRLADAAAFENAGVDRSQFLSNLQFKVELVGGGNGRIVVTSLSSVVEPYLDFIVEARWPNGKMIREYTVLLDLPVYADDSQSRAINLSNAAPAASQNVPLAAPASQAREPGGSIGAVDRAPPVARSPAQQQDLPPADNPSEYRIQHHDTMWRIATTLRPSSYVTTQQTMLALAKKNPKAFVNGNVNQIKSGYVLRVPSEAEVRDIDHQAALKEIRLQAKEWRGEKVARAAKTKASSSTASAAPMAPQIDATAKSQVPASKKGANEAVKFSLGGSDDSDSINEANILREQIREERENLEKSKLENGAIQNRVVEMEKQIQTLQRLIALKNSQLATLQSGQSLPESLAVSTDNIAVLEADAMVAPTGTEAETEIASASSPDAEAEKIAATEAAKQTIIDKPAAKPVITETPLEALQAWVSQNLVIFVGLLLALLAALVLLVRARRAADEDADLTGFDNDLAAGEAVKSPALFASGREFDADSAVNDRDEIREEGDADGVFSVDDFDFDKLADDPAAEDALSSFADDLALEESSGVDDVDGPAADAVVAQTGDVVAEAEIYVAYGRYDQAAGLLKTAIAQYPSNTELHLKLIDIYLDTRDQSNFESAYQDLRALNDDDAIARVKESMSAIEGVSHWLGDDLSVSSDNTVQVAGPDGSASKEITDLDFDIDDDADADALSLDDEGLDLELDDALDDNAGVAASEELDVDAASDTDTLASLDVDLADLDFDFDGDFGGESKEPSALADDNATAGDDSAEALSVEGTTSSAEAVVEDEELDISFDGLDDVSLDENVLSELTSTPDDGDGLDDDIVSFEDKDVPSLNFTDLEALEPESTDVDDLDFEDLELSTIGIDDSDTADTDLGASGLGDSGIDVSDLDVSSDTLGAVSDLSSVEAPLTTPESGDDEAVGVTSEELSNNDSDIGELDLSEFDMDLSDTLDTSALSLDAATESDELDLELSDFDMPSEFSSASEASAPADELDVDVDESFFLDDDLELEVSAVPTDDMKVDSGSTADKQKVAAEMPVVETPAPGAPIVDADTVNIDGDAIAIEDLVFDEFDAGEDDAEGFDSLLDSESVGTKLDLARAYIDMGDSEGAREMLEEVRQEGDTQQQADAQTLLDNIG